MSRADTAAAGALRCILRPGCLPIPPDAGVFGAEPSRKDTLLIAPITGLAKGERCLTYSVGIADVTDFDRAVSYHVGCEVHMFDPTVPVGQFPEVLVDATKTPSGGSATFHYVGLGDPTRDDSKLTFRSVFKTEAAVLSGRDKTGLRGRILTLDDAMRSYGHAKRRLTILKMDCEGCEWPVLDSLRQRPPDQLPLQLKLELHFQKSLRVATRDEFRRVLRVSQFLLEFYVLLHAEPHGCHPDESEVVPELMDILPERWGNTSFVPHRDAKRSQNNFVAETLWGLKKQFIVQQ
jgi:hypothetical protein